ncbi:hypothetical protein GGI12_004502 [Dipsacomyces acuminosporus]|nr:hypothetical protein GGI12_004502 [Dipsacomyces acuminosporus]
MYTSLWKPTTSEQKVYNYLFAQANIDNTGLVSIDEARVFLQQSNIPAAELSKVFELLDINNKVGRLTRREFHLALKLVSLAQSSKPISLKHLLDHTPLPRFSGIQSQVESSVSPTLASFRESNLSSTSVTEVSEERLLVRPSLVVDDTEIAALLHQINQLVDSSSAKQHDPSGEEDGTEMSGRPGSPSVIKSIENQLAITRTLYERESRLNKELVEKLHAREQTIEKLYNQVKRASKCISLLSMQRGKLVERIEEIEKQQLELQQILVSNQYEAQRLNTDLSSFGYKIRNLEQNMSNYSALRAKRSEERRSASVQDLPRHSSVEEDEETMSPGSNQETLWRSRLSALFKRKHA